MYWTRFKRFWVWVHQSAGLNPIVKVWVQLKSAWTQTRPDCGQSSSSCDCFKFFTFQALKPLLLSYPECHLVNTYLHLLGAFHYNSLPSNGPVVWAHLFDQKIYSGWILIALQLIQKVLSRHHFYFFFLMWLWTSSESWNTDVFWHLLYSAVYGVHFGDNQWW